LLPGGKFSSDWNDMLRYTDHEVLVALREAAASTDHAHHILASRMMSRRHFRTIYELSATHKMQNPNIFSEILDDAKNELGDENVRSDHYGPKSETNNFPVLLEDGTVASSLNESGVIARTPPIEIGLIFAPPETKDRARAFIKDRLQTRLVASSVRGG